MKKYLRILNNIQSLTPARFRLLSLTWGLPMTAVGVGVALCLLARGCRPERRHGVLCFSLGEGWGGLTLGPVILCQRNASAQLLAHELGHALQNCLFGPLMPLLTLASAARYHDRSRRAKQGEALPDYDAFWLEAQATRLGNARLSGRN